MFGEKKILLEGAKKARDKIFEKGEHKHTFCIDCFTRLLFLKEELEIINKNGDIDGVISLGEIGNNGESFLESYNKTIVIAQW